MIQIIENEKQRILKEMFELKNFQLSWEISKILSLEDSQTIANTLYHMDFSNFEKLVTKAVSQHQGMIWNS